MKYCLNHGDSIVLAGIFGVTLGTYHVCGYCSCHLLLINPALNR